MINNFNNICGTLFSENHSWQICSIKVAELIECINIYCESPPLRDDKIGYGLGRAIYPIIKSLSDHLGDILIYPNDGWVKSDEIRSEYRSNIRMVGGNLIAKICAKIDGLSRSGISHIIYKFVASLPLSTSKAKVLLSVIGADYRALERADVIARRNGWKHIVYMVDDFLTIKSARLSNTDVIEKVSSILRDATNVFCITNNLATRCSELYGVSASELRLPYAEAGEPIKESERSNVVLYAGAVNFLYRDTLRAVIGEIAKLNEEIALPIRLRLTAPVASVHQMLGDNIPDFVSVEPFESHSDLIMALSTCRMALLPYSFSEEARVMVTTSFPSKFLDYLAAAKNIVAIIPEYAAINSEISEVGAITVLRTPGEIVDVLTDQEMYPDNSMNYREALSRSHSLSTFRDRVISCL